MTTLISLFKAVLMASWQGSLAIVLVLMTRQALGARVPARWRHLLWVLVLVRLLAPAVTLPHNPASLQNIPAVARPFEPAPVAAEPEFVAPISVAVIHPRVVRWTAWQWGALVWAMVAGAFGVALAASAWRMQRRLRGNLAPVDPATLALWRDRCRELLRREAPRLVAVDWIASPALVGIWRPTLLIPRNSAFSPEDWEHVFAHEIAHLRCRDHWSQGLQLIALGVHWFNPLVWLGFRRLRADRELAADEWALRRLEDGRSLAYGATLLKAVSGRSAFQPGMVGISEDGSQMKQRLQRIVAFLPRRPRYGSALGGAIVLLLAAVVLGQKPAAPPATNAPDVLDQLHAAARAGDSKEVARLIHDERAPGLGDEGAKKMLDDLVRDRELTAFTTLLDQLRQTNLGRDWKLRDELLAGLVKDDRRDFLNALFARNLDLEPLRRLAKSEWIERRLAEVAKQRADINALGRAANDGDLPAIRRLLDAGVDVNAVDKDDNTILIETVHKDRLEAAQLLLDRGADPNKPRFPGWNYTPLCLVNSVPMAELLKKAGGDVHAKLFGRNTSILTYVAVWSKPEVVAWFLDQGLDPKMIGDNDETLLFDLREARTAELLLDRGVDPNRPNEFGATPICSARTPEVAQTLIEHGAKVTGLKEPLLPKMIQFGSAGAVEAVLKAQGKPDHAEMQLALLDACFMDRAEIAQVLLKHGANPNEPTLWHAREEEKTLPLLACTINPSAKTAQVLLDAGADPNAGDPPGLILRNAVGNGRKETAEILRKAGARGVADLAYNVTIGDQAKIDALLAAAPLFSDNPAFWESAMPNAIAAGDLRTVRAAIDHGVPVSSNEVSAAAEAGQAEILSLVLAQRKGRWEPEELRFPLWQAVHESRSYDHQPKPPGSDYEKCASALIAAGAPLDGGKDQRFPMMAACFTAKPGGNLAMIELLVNAGADPNPPVKTERPSGGRLLDYIQEQLASEPQRRFGPNAEVIAALRRFAGRRDPEEDKREYFMSSVAVSAPGGTPVNDGSTMVYSHAPAPRGTMLGAAKVETDGAAPVRFPIDAKSVRLAVVRPDFAPLFAGPFEPPFGDKLKHLALTLDRGFTASVLLVDKAGQPIAGTKLEAYYPGPPFVDGTKAARMEVITDANGLATFEHIGAAPLNIRLVYGNGEREEVIKAPLDPGKPFQWTVRRPKP